MPRTRGMLTPTARPSEDFPTTFLDVPPAVTVAPRITPVFMPIHAGMPPWTPQGSTTAGEYRPARAGRDRTRRARPARATRWCPPGSIPFVPPGSVPGTVPAMQDHARAWLQRQTTRWQDWPSGRLLAAKRAAGTRISVVIPARNEERSVGRVVGALRQALLVDTPLVDEIIVVDSDSTDGTARAAERAGAAVHRARDIAPELGSYPGKGEALWKSLLVTEGDLQIGRAHV